MLSSVLYMRIRLYSYIAIYWCGMEKTNLSNEALELIAVRFKILSEPLRLRILQTLGGGEMSVNELAEAVKSSQPNISKHLKMLQDAGILSRRQQGNSVFYAIADESIFALCELVCGALEERLKNHAKILALV